MVEIDLNAYGQGTFQCSGTLQSKSLRGTRLLLLFGERHNMKPFIRNTLLNTIGLDKLGVLSCVGVEGHPTREFPGGEALALHRRLREQHANDDEKVVEEMLRGIRGRDFHYWKVLRLMREHLVIESVDDKDLCERAADLSIASWYESRREYILATLRRSSLTEISGFDLSENDKEHWLYTQATLQVEQELGEHEVHLARDHKLLGNMLALWNKSGMDKVAVLNAGSGHQYRIARNLPSDVSYYHIDQP